MSGQLQSKLAEITLGNGIEITDGDINNYGSAAEYDWLNDQLPKDIIIAPKKLATRAIDLAYDIPHKQTFAGKELNLIGNELAGTGWQIAFKSSDFPETSGYGYKGVVLVNHNTKEVHIASAGTLPNIYDGVDDFCIAAGITPFKFAPAQATLKKVVRDFGNEYIISSSGHSLGALFSDYIITLAKLQGLKVDKSTTFESPGTAKEINKVIKDYEDINEIKVDGEELKKHFEVFNALPNPINTFNPHFGKVHLAVFKGVKEEEVLGTGVLWYQQYLYKKIGAILIYPCLEYLNLNRVIKEHSLKNFMDEENYVSYPVKTWDKDGKIVLEYSEKFASCKSTGKAVTIYREQSDSASLSSRLDSQPLQFAYSDLACRQEEAWQQSSLLGNNNYMSLAEIIS